MGCESIYTFTFDRKTGYQLSLMQNGIAADPDYCLEMDSLLSDGSEELHALLSREAQNAKLPYALHHKAAFESREKLSKTRFDYYIIAHKGICTGADFPALCRDNDSLILRRAEEILNLVTRSMSFSEIDRAVCANYRLLTRQPRRALRFERNVRFFVEYLADEGYLDMECVDGTVYYRASGKKF